MGNIDIDSESCISELCHKIGKTNTKRIHVVSIYFASNLIFSIFCCNLLLHNLAHKYLFAYISQKIQNQTMYLGDLLFLGLGQKSF